MTDPLIGVEDAASLPGRDDVVFLDASWTFSGGPPMPAARHIPGSRLIDIDTVCDRDSALPHMLPSPEEFEAHARALGLSGRHTIIVYDRMGLFSAPRVWWMFRAMGHAAVRVLDGGLPKWEAEGLPVVPEPATNWARGDFVAALQPARIAGRQTVLDAIRSDTAQILDARPPVRFSGQAPEPRAGLRSGHMPGALNLPYSRLIDDQGCLCGETIAMREAGVDCNRPVITTCGSGVSACILALALERMGYPAAVYDGSWTEWGRHSDTPVETD